MSALDEAAAQLEQLGVDRGALAAGFDTVLRRHEALAAVDYNDDGAYRKALDQVIFPLLQAHGQASTMSNGLCLHLIFLLLCFAELYDAGCVLPRFYRPKCLPTHKDAKLLRRRGVLWDTHMCVWHTQPVRVWHIIVCVM